MLLQNYYLFNSAIAVLSFNHTLMHPSEDHSGITKNLIVSKILIKNSRRLLTELEKLIKQRESDARRRKAFLVHETTKEPPLLGGSGD